MYIHIDFAKWINTNLYIQLRRISLIILWYRDGILADIGRAGSLHEFLNELHNKFGDIASFWMGQQLTVSLASPQTHKDVAHLFDRPGQYTYLFNFYLQFIIYIYVIT